MEMTKTKQTLLKVAETWASQMKLNLQAKVKRTTVRAEWQNGKPKNVTYKSIRANHVATGNLVNSIEVIEKKKTYAVSMLWYGEVIDKGRAKGKGIPVDVMKSWTDTRQIRPRNLKNGQFIKNTANNRNAMAFCMNRKIKYFGIEAYPFIEKSKEIAMQMHQQDVKENVGKDIKGFVFRLMKSKVPKNNKK
jgi:hypothetical protein